MLTGGRGTYENKTSSLFAHLSGVIVGHWRTANGSFPEATLVHALPKRGNMRGRHQYHGPETESDWKMCNVAFARLLIFLLEHRCLLHLFLGLPTQTSTCRRFISVGHDAISQLAYRSQRSTRSSIIIKSLLSLLLERPRHYPRSVAPYFQTHAQY